MHQLSKSDQGSEDKCLTSLSLNVLSQSGLELSSGWELPICCTSKRTEILLQAGIWTHLVFGSLLLSPAPSSLASKDHHFTQYDYMSAPIEMIPLLNRQRFCAWSAMLFIHYRPHSSCLTHAGGSHRHHWRAAAKAAACLSELTSQGWVTHTSFDSKIGGSPGLGKGESDSWPQIKGSFAPIGRGWQELVLKRGRSPMRSPGQGTQHHSPTSLLFVNYQHTWDAQQREGDILDSCTSNTCMHVMQELVLCAKFPI